MLVVIQPFLLLQLGTLGAGNHYAEIQVVDEIYNDYAAKKMGIDHAGQVRVGTSTIFKWTTVQALQLRLYYS